MLQACLCAHAARTIVQVRRQLLLEDQERKEETLCRQERALHLMRDRMARCDCPPPRA